LGPFFPLKVPFHIVQARREKLAQLLEQHRYLPIQELCRRLGVSEATARRDLAALVEEKKITRTYGGALSEFNDRFPSFRQRQGQAAHAKSLIAKAALAFIQPGQTIFLDSGTTIFAIAEALREKPVTPLTVVTSNLPVGEMLAGVPELMVFQVAGQIFLRQSVLLGDAALKSLDFWNFDIAFLSAEAMAVDGIWNTESAIVEQQKRTIRRSRRSIFCIDSSKIGRTAPHFLLDWHKLDLLICDAAPAKFEKLGIALPEGKFYRATGRKSENPPVTTEVAQKSEEGALPVHYL
jgi:DeoR/GlpR family transcriptional regulator of sugar metabolism